MNSYKQYQVTYILVNEFLSESYQYNIEDDQYYLHWSKSVKSDIYQIGQNSAKILPNLTKFDQH